MSPCSRQIVLPRLRLRQTTLALGSLTKGTMVQRLEAVWPASLKYVKVIFFIPSLEYVEVMFCIYILLVVKLQEAAQPDSLKYVRVMFFILSLEYVEVTCCI